MKSVNWRILTAIENLRCIYMYIYIYIYIYNFFSDVDECAKRTHTCSANAVCTNTKGSFKCTCKTGYLGYGNICTKRKFFLVMFSWGYFVTIFSKETWVFCSYVKRFAFISSREACT